MNILITGANGFIGSHVTEVLAGRGHRLRGLVQPGTPTDNLDGMDVEIHPGDVRDADALGRACEGQEAVVHLAAIPSDWAPAALIEAVNVGGTRNLVDAALGAGCRRLVLMSSLAVHESRGHRHGREDTPRDRWGLPYAESKRQAEDVVLAPDLRDRLETVVLRPGLVPFGPRDRLFSLTACQMLRKGIVPLINGGRTAICTSYVENLAEGVALAAEHERAAYETLILGDDGAPSWADLFRAFASELGVSLRIPGVPWAPMHGVALGMEAIWGLADRMGLGGTPPLTRYRVDLMRHDFHFESARAKRLLGYAPAVDLREGAARTVAWVRAEERRQS